MPVRVDTDRNRSSDILPSEGAFHPAPRDKFFVRGGGAPLRGNEVGMLPPNKPDTSLPSGLA